MCIVAKGTWVEVERVVSRPGERVPPLGKDLLKPLQIVRVSGFLLEDAELGQQVRIRTIQGKLHVGNVRAALITAMIRALAEELKPLAREPGNFLRKLNSDLCSILKSTGSPMLTTAFYLVANWQTGKMRFANAGHPKPLLLHRSTGRIELLAHASGRGEPALGLFDNPTYQTTEIAIAPGSCDLSSEVPRICQVSRAA